MAVSEVRLTATGASGGVEGSDAKGVKVSFSSTYLAKCDSPSDGPNTVLRHFLITGSLPWIGRTYKFGNDFNTTAVCRSVRPVYIDGSGGMFTVSCDFADAEQEQQQQNPTQDGKQSTNPLEWLPEIEVSWGSYSTPVEYATFLQTLNGGAGSAFLKPGKFCPVTNSSLQPLDPTFEETYSFKILRFTKNLSSYDDDFFNKYQDSINKEETTISLRRLKFKTVIAKHHGKLNVGASLNFQNGVMYYRRSIEVQVRPWDRAILDQGTNELYFEGDTLNGTTVSASDLPTGRLSIEVPIKDNDDNPTGKPLLLDGNGKRLKEGKPPVSLVWRTFDEADFSQIDW